FGTLGAYPDSPHALGCIRDSEAMLKKEGSNNNVLGSFLCLGKIDPKLIDYMGKFMGDTHPVTPERKERLLQAQTHPDENDLEQVKAVFKNFAERLRL
ncbi:MAG: flavodoxin family protein, partial [Candidatus Mucispirillum faecigallinarum]|nr:flavodoxin family protein [Candidatus Mucispirillum faecigallinarum]